MRRIALVLWDCYYSLVSFGLMAFAAIKESHEAFTWWLLLTGVWLTTVVVRKERASALRQ